MSLIEIIIVIVLVTTVMTIVAGGIVAAQDDAKVEETKLRMKKLEQALQLYAARHKGQYPSTSEGLAPLEKYLDGQPAVDAWNREFLYFSPGTESGKDYEIKSLGKDGAEGGDDNDADIKSWEH
jgi:general secretion pathway protein G